jgi:hypothetical protein
MGRRRHEGAPVEIAATWRGGGVKDAEQDSNNKS